MQTQNWLCEKKTAEPSSAMASVLTSKKLRWTRICSFVLSCRN